MILDEGQEGETVKYVGSAARAATAGDPHLAEDLAQEVLLFALANSPRDDGRRLAWLRSITQRKHRFARFRSATRPQQSTNTDAELERTRGREYDPAQRLTQAELRSRVHDLLLALPEAQREIVHLRAVEDLPPREVAKRLGIPVETVRTTYRRSLETLRRGADREGGDDALRDWRLPALAFALPKRVALSAFGLVSALLVTAAIYWNLQEVQDLPETLAPIDTLVELAAVSTSVDIAALPVEERRLAAPVLARVDLRLFSNGQAVGGEEITLSNASGDVVLGRTDSGGWLEWAELRPGSWKAWYRGELLDSKQLESGANAWALHVELELDMTIRVIDVGGQSAPEIDVYRYDEATNRTALLGQTDATGQLEARIPVANSWVAARGVAGFSSLGLSVDQPFVKAQGGVVQLILREHPVTWHQINLGEEVGPDSGIVVARSGGAGSRSIQSINMGIRRGSGWLPPWRRADKAYGVKSGCDFEFAALDEAGELWWVSRGAGGTHPTGSILEAKAPFSVRGQLVDTNGRPLAGLDVFVTGGPARHMSDIRTTSDEGGRFTLTGCPDDLVNLRSEFGKRRLVKRPTEGRAVDIGKWELRKVAVMIEALGFPGSLRCTTFNPALRRSSNSLPERNPSLVGSMTQVFASPGSEHCKVEVPYAAVGAAILVEAGAGMNPKAALLKRPHGGWTGKPLRVDLATADSIRLRAEFPTDRFPVRGVWVEDDCSWTSTALADPVSGTIRSAPLPAGRWSLKIMDRHSVTTQSGIATVRAGDHHDFGAMSIEMGWARVSLRHRDTRSQSQGGALKVHQDVGVGSATMVFMAGELVPPETMIELPLGSYRFALELKGEGSAVGKGVIERGLVADVTLSSEHFLVRLGNKSRGEEPSLSASLKLVDSMGYEHWSTLIPPVGEEGARTMLVPRIPNTWLRTERSDGTLLADLSELIDLTRPFKAIRFEFEQWTDSEQ